MSDRSNSLLSHGAIGIDRINRINVLVKPIGLSGKYVGYCHVFVIRTRDDSDDQSTTLPAWRSRRPSGPEESSTVRRTVKGIRESELADWLRVHGGVNQDYVSWIPGNWNPAPDTYLRDKLAPSTEAIA